MRDELVTYCNETLKLHEYPDYGPMGLQYKGTEEVKRIAQAVSVSRDVIYRAAREDCQALIVHHGMFWNTESREIDKRTRGRLDALEETGITLLAYHLALDAHPEIGNNVNAARMMGVEEIVPFGGIGAGGKLETPISINDLRLRAHKAFGGSTMLLYGHERPVERLAAITGSAGSYIVQAAKEGYDCFITGEAEEPTMYLARELGIHFLACGHHATEKSGLMALGRLILRDLNIPSTFIETENPV